MQSNWIGVPGSNLTAYTGLHSFYLDWLFFPCVFPPNLYFISLTILKHGTKFNYGPIETRLKELSLCLLVLEEIRVVHHRNPVLNDEIELRRKLHLQGVTLVVEVEKVYRGEGENSLVTSYLIC